MKESSSQLVSFYKGEGIDHQGRTIREVWQLSHFWLEHTHDYIQWLFPIPEAGRFNSFAPLLQYEDQIAFANEESLQSSQRRSLDVMLAFFGLERQGGGINALPELNMREHTWLKRGGHNHLRISRIIRSLHLCHQPGLAEAFQQAVIVIGTTQGVVSEQSVSYWRSANKS
ncbi:opioid growth factor receptor-related protein [Vreelandella venusta]|uniref:Opioid growth factor receptor (OGFr) conserved domain-containing protein n=1 Tax=Vreelandella venusta TaxID=44935 RepID=A0AAP9ZBI1_9GAMM|nr:opioid growth factor receptor-related protein [Halomonas venusta]QRL02432.1 hypothetical protein JDS37_14145 [Halomonas venusta]GEK49477.1 hypothetical protein HVE01_01980 [Halomonas venusta]